MNRRRVCALSMMTAILVSMIALAAWADDTSTPVADAGRDQRIYQAGELVTLEGKASLLPDPCAPDEFLWTQIAGEPVELRDANTATPSFVPLIEGEYTFELVVMQGPSCSAPDAVVVSVGSTPTVAAGQVWPVDEGGNGHAYQALAVPMLIPWTMADAAATSAGGYLATITSQQENDFVYGLISGDGDGFFAPMMGNHYGPWIGGYQLPGAPEPAGGWVWVTGEPFEYTAWAVGEPSQTAGALNEDKLHYLGHGGPEPYWNDQVNSLDFGPMSCVIEYDPATCEAEEAGAVSGGLIESSHGGHSDTGYVRFDGGAGGTIRSSIFVGMAGPKSVRVRYANGAPEEVSIQVCINGAVTEANLPCPSTGGWDLWKTVTTDAYLNPGENTVELSIPAECAGLSIDGLTIFDDQTNLVLNKRITFSQDSPSAPAAHAIDTDPITVWRADGLPQWLEVDLGDVYDVYCTKVLCFYDRTHQFKVEVKARAGDPFTLVVDRTDETAGQSMFEALADTFPPVPARYVRLTVTGVVATGAGDTAIAEFAVNAISAASTITIDSVPYRTIQDAVDAADHGDVILLEPGTYSGLGNTGVNMRGKTITLCSTDPDDPDSAARTIIAGDPTMSALIFTGGEDANCVVAGLTIRGARTGIYCDYASPTIRNCRILGCEAAGIQLWTHTQPTIQNCLIAGSGGPGIAIDPEYGRAAARQNYPYIVNCTIADNLGFGIRGGAPTIVNSIIYHNGCEADSVQISKSEATVTCCDVQGGGTGDGNLDVDPQFACRGSWLDADDPNITVPPGTPGASWICGDYHLKSEVGRWDSAAQDWVSDEVTSPCIDLGDPGSDWMSETWPHGERINLGVYGGTWQASLSPSDR